jgi:phospholipid-transporting ATPase
VIINEENAHDTQEFITKRLNAIKNQRKSGELEDLALVIGACKWRIYLLVF